MDTKKELARLSNEELIRLVLELREKISALEKENRSLQENVRLLKADLARSKKSRPSLK